MATNAQRVFDITMGMIDELSSSGATDTSDTKEYKDRTLFILNLIRGELYPYSDTYKLVEVGKRPIAKVIADFKEDIDLDDYICQSVMPYGLAAHLLLDENPTAAAYFNSRYEDLFMQLKSGFSQGSVEIEDVYGGIEYGEFSRW